MNVTISELRLSISTQGAKVNKLFNELRRHDTKMGHREVTSKEVEYISDPFDYAAGLVDAEEAMKQLVAYKNALTKANATTVLEGETLTIAEAINVISEKRTLLSVLNSALNRTPSKLRRSEVNGSSYYEVTELNYDKESIEAKAEAVRAEIDKLESLIDKANASTVISLP